MEADLFDLYIYLHTMGKCQFIAYFISKGYLHWLLIWHVQSTMEEGSGRVLDLRLRSHWFDTL